MGYKAFFSVIKAAAMGGGVLNLVLQGEISKILYPLMECLKEFGIEGPNGVLRVYYLGCYHELQRKVLSIVSLNLSVIFFERITVM